MNLHAKKNRDIHIDEVDLCIGNRVIVAALAIGSYYLSLPSELLLNLNNYYYIFSMNRNLLLNSMLDFEGFTFVMKNGSFSIYKDEIVMV